MGMVVPAKAVSVAVAVGMAGMVMTAMIILMTIVVMVVTAMVVVVGAMVMALVVRVIMSMVVTAVIVATVIMSVVVIVAAVVVIVAAVVVIVPMVMAAMIMPVILFMLSVISTHMRALIFAEFSNKSSSFYTVPAYPGTQQHIYHVSRTCHHLYPNPEHSHADKTKEYQYVLEDAIRVLK